MTEKEKMLKGELYDANNDKSLIKDREKCKVLCFKYNNLSPDKTNKRKELIKKLLQKQKTIF